MMKFLATILALAVAASTAVGTTTVPETPEKPEVSEVTTVTDGEMQEIVNNGEIVFSIKSLEKNAYDEMVLNVYVENNTNQDLSFSIMNTCVNGWICEAYWGCEVTAGMKANEEIVWYENVLEENHISDFTGIESDLYVMDMESWEPVYNGRFTYYPDDEEAFTVMEYEPQETDVVLVDNDIATISAIFLNPNNEWEECQLRLYVKNKTDKAISVGCRNAAVNGFMCEAYWACDLPEERQAFSNLTWYSSMLVENQIDEVESFTLPFYAVDVETFEELFSETVTLNKADLLMIE